MDAAERERNRQRIKEEIKEKIITIRKLRTLYNEQSAVSRLPPEILSTIFSLNATTGNSSHILGWYKVTHVCGHWRTVALSSPRLWTSISFAHPSWALEMLKRSMGASLSIHAELSISTPKILHAVQKALRELERTIHLHISTRSLSSLQKLLNKLPSSAPVLETLSLAGPHRSHATGNVTSEGFTFSLSHAPLLRRLTLIQCRINWDTSVMNGLTDLQIQYVPLSARPTMKQLLTALENMPNLQHLHLVSALPIPGDLSVCHIVDLPCLVGLNILAPIGECINLMGHLSLSAKVVMTIDCDDETVNSRNSLIDLLKRTVEPRLRRGMRHSNVEEEARLVQTLSIEREYTTKFSIEMWSDIIPLCNSLPDNRNPSVKVTLFYRDELQSFANAICEAIPLSQIKSLFICAGPDLDSPIKGSEWEIFIEKFPNLQHIDLGEHSAHNFIETLLHSLQDNDISQTTLHSLYSIPKAQLPFLKTLSIRYASFKPKNLSTICTWERFLDFLMQRFEYGVDIHEIILTCCKFLTEEHINSLKNIVTDVTWDGVEDDIDSECEFSDEDGDSLGSSNQWYYN